MEKYTILVAWLSDCNVMVFNKVFGTSDKCCSHLTTSKTNKQLKVEQVLETSSTGMADSASNDKKK